MELGLKIKELRIKHGLTQDDLASKLGVSFQTISKWENLVTMPDVALLPDISEAFGVTIDELFDLSIEQKMNRIESKMELEEEFKYSEFCEIEEFLKSHMAEEEYKYRSTALLAYLYTHRLMSDSKKIKKYARQAILLDPTKKECQWMIGKTGNYECWDWNMDNHTEAINFYKEVVNSAPDASLAYYYLIDNLIADHRVDEAQEYLNTLEKLRPNAIVMINAYKAGIALAKYQESEADMIMANLEKEHIEEDGCLFEIAQYYAKKGQFRKAISYYELSFEKTKRRPRFTDELLSIIDIYDILGDYKKEVETYDRLLDCYKNEWNMSEEVELKDVEERRMKVLGKIK
ncbi:MAG: helix-turn-helix transcriptional regulator [Bacilli bacterium]|nr:helix-turn-helix transcriptional regulator [Bacilli bacterium]